MHHPRLRRSSGPALFMLLFWPSACAGAQDASQGTGAPGTDPSPLPDPVAELLALPPLTPEEEDAALALLDSVADQFRSERWTDAVESYRRLARAAPLLADWMAVLEAEAWARAGMPERASEILSGEPSPMPPTSRWGWRLEVEALENAGRTVAGAERAARAGAELADAGARAAAWLRAGELYEAAGEDSQARAAFVRTLREAPASISAGGALERLPAAERLSPDETELVLTAARARSVPERKVEILPGHLTRTDRREERLELAGALLELDRPAEALQWLAPLVRPGSEDPAALVLYGRSELALGRGAAGQATLLRVAGMHPGDPGLAGEALLAVARWEMDRGQPDLAIPSLRGAYRTGVRDPVLDLHSVRWGSRSYLQGDHADAALFFDHFADGHPLSGSRQQGLFWAALSLERAGERNEALRRYERVHQEDPLSYYGMLAGERLGEPLLPAALPPGPPIRPELTPAIANALFRLRVHQKVPTAGSFAFELNRLQDHFSRIPGGSYALAEGLIEGGFPIQGIVLGRDVHRDEGEWNLRLLRIVHPFPHRETIIRESRTRGLDPFFVAGLIRQESMFRDDIRSSAGAVGLMQVMPATAREVARGLGLSGFSAAQLADASVNVRIGTEFLSQMLDRFDGRATDALIAYNAGPTRARSWRSMEEYGDPDVFAEHIPFRETRHYVKVVQQYTRMYTALYGCEDFSPCLGISYPTWLAIHGPAPGASAPLLTR